MDVRPMRLSDIDAVVGIHERVLPTTTARIRLLPHFYTTMCKHTKLHVALVAVEKNHVIGAITATRDARRTQSLLLSPRVLFQTAWAIISGRVAITELVDRMVTERNIQKIASPYQTILTLVVDTAFQRKGIGKKLVSSLPITGKLYVDTEITNTKAQLFYKRSGFRFIKTIRSSMVAVKTLNNAP